MCGIAGVLAFDDRWRVPEALLVRMRDEMVHRGPDGAGLWLRPDGRLGLAHRRLAIIDRSPAAAQPMATPDGRLRIVFNGEIYNHAALRRELEGLGHARWQTDHSDTEVILEAWREWGIACLERLRGMFAFGLWDETEQALYLVRDRIGVKPLYYAVHHGRLCFASEIKALLADPELPRRIHEEALFHYLSFLTTPAPQTLLDGVMKLPGGTWLRVEASGRMEERRYWDVWEHVEPLVGRSDDEIAEQVLGTLRESVALRKISDVPVGVFLSGGVDSSTNAALFGEGSDEPVRTFSIGYDADYGSYPSELPYARRMAEHIHAKHEERRLSIDDLIGFVDRMVWLQDEPIADPVCVPVHYVSKLARDAGVVVCQVGEGADELFWGYPSWKRALQIDRWNRLPVPRALKDLTVAGLGAAGKGESVYTEWLRRGAAGAPMFWSGAEVFSDRSKRTLLSDRLNRRFAGFSSWEAVRPEHERFQRDAWEPSLLHWMSHADLHLRLPELLLMRVDKMAMGVSLEARVPFLDHELVELALGIPTEVKTRGGVTKALLKRAVRGIVPDELIDRPKQGFGVPIYEWCFERLGDHIREATGRFCRETDLFDPRAVAALVAQRPGQPAWSFYNLALWWEKFVA